MAYILLAFQVPSFVLFFSVFGAFRFLHSNSPSFLNLQLPCRCSSSCCCHTAAAVAAATAAVAALAAVLLLAVWYIHIVPYDTIAVVVLLFDCSPRFVMILLWTSMIVQGTRSTPKNTLKKEYAPLPLSSTYQLPVYSYINPRSTRFTRRHAPLSQLCVFTRGHLSLQQRAFRMI